LSGCDGAMLAWNCACVKFQRVTTPSLALPPGATAGATAGG
jgi:hypothetical protein